MFLLYPVLLVFTFTTLVAMALPPHSRNIAVRFPKHRRHILHQNPSHNLTLARAAPEATIGHMSLVDMYSGSSFFDKWDFSTDPDPTHGNVRYVSKAEAFSAGLASVGSDNVAVIAVDDNSTIPVGGNRRSVRITSQKVYNGGLFVLDVNAMPTGCATWPAFWTVAGQNWPRFGEIDIVEGVNKQTRNQMSLHTAPGCQLDATAPPSRGHTKPFSGQLLGPICDAVANSNSGCGILERNEHSFGAGVERAGGAVFAMLWDTVGIRIWHFDRTNTPPDLTAHSPNPSSWPTPSAFWSTATCPVDQFFKNHNIVINTSLCGDFAGSAYPTSGCPATCAEHVADPNNFKDAKWKINYLATYLWQ